MRNGPKPALLKDKINYQVMGDNTWKHAPSIREMSNETLTLYLTDAKVDDRYQLARTKPAIAVFIEQVVDFSDRKTQINLFSRVAIENTLNFENSYTFVS